MRLAPLILLASLPTLWDMAVDIESGGHHSIIVIPGFHSWQACKSAGLQVQARFGKHPQNDGYSADTVNVDFICVPKQVK